MSFIKILKKITEPHIDPRVVHAMERDIWLTRKEKDRGTKRGISEMIEATRSLRGMCMQYQYDMSE